MKKLICVLLFAAVVVPARAFDVSVTNMVGIPAGSTSTVILPSVIKAGSDWTPLFRINISTTMSYTLNAATVTIVRQNPAFDAATDLLAPGSGLVLFKDDGNGIWEGSSVESLCTASYSPSSLTEDPADSWITKMTLSTNKSIASGDNYFFLAIKTSQNISDGAQFSADFASANALVLEFSDSSTETGNYGAAATMTADTVAPAIQIASYSPDADKGTTSSIENQDAVNVYKEGGTIDLRFYLAENAAALDPGTDYALSDLVQVSSQALLGSAGSATATLTYLGAANQFRLQYAITSSTINQNTDGAAPINLPIRVRDAAGNWSAWDSSFYVHIDSKTPDAVVITSPAANDVWFSTITANIEWTATTELHFTQNGYHLVVATSSEFTGDLNIKELGTGDLKTTIPENGAWTNNGANGDINAGGGLSTGESYFAAIRVVDDVDHSSTLAALAAKAVRVKYDREKPNVEWDTFSGATSTNTASPSVRAYIGDYGRSGVSTATIVMKLEDNNNVKRMVPSSSYTSSYDAATGSFTVIYTPAVPLEDGRYRLSMKASDKVQNESAEVAGGWFTVDTKSPSFVDSDNDGVSDLKEKVAGTDWLDATDGGGTDSWPLNGQKVNYATLVSGNDSKINIWLDDVNSDAGSTGIDLAASTVTVTLADSTVYVYGANDLPYPKLNQATPSASGNGFAYNSTSFKVQIPRALRKDGSDDGTITVRIYAEDTVGNQSGAITRTFIYDNTASTITAVSTPTEAATGDIVIFSVDVTDANGVSDAADAVKFWLDGDSNSMSKSTSTANRYHYTSGLEETGTFSYYFTARDYAGNISTYPAGADTNSAQAIYITVTDGIGPWAVIGNDTGGAGASKTGAPDSYIKTLVGVNTSGITKNYNHASAPKVSEIPNVYSASNNILQATLEDDAVLATFQYKLASTSTWSNLVSTEVLSQVWQATWDTSALASNQTYDIRVIGTDNSGNVSTPSSVNSPGWVQVGLKPALGPVATIDTAVNNSVVGDGNAINNFAVLCASVPVPGSGNIDIASVAFQYRASASSAWTDIAVDTDPSSVDGTTVTFKFRKADWPRYLVANDALKIYNVSDIDYVEFDCTTDAYKRSMQANGSVWETTVALPPGSYQYKFWIAFKDGTSQSVRDVNEQATAGGNSQLTVKAYSALWDVSQLTEGSYQVRALAKDSRDVADNNPQHITMIVDRTAPSSAVITDPTSTDNRLEAGADYELRADVTGTDVNHVFFLYSKDGGSKWARANIADIVDNDGWSVTLPLAESSSLVNDADWKIKAFAVDEAGNMVESAELDVIMDATDPAIIDFKINGISDSSVDVDYGTTYSWSVTTLDTDISNLSFATSGLVDYAWSPGDNLTSYSGSGTEADPYIFSGTLLAAIDSARDNLTLTITATLEDKAGRTDSVVKNVNLFDVTPSEAYIKAIDGFVVRPGEQLTVSNRYVQVKAGLDDPDSGVLKYQYRASGASSWITWKTAASANNDEQIFPPAGIAPIDGVYEMRILCIDDDNNADPDPAVVTVTVDSSLPAIKPASIISANYDGTAGLLGAIEYDELVDQVKFEYRAAGGSWTTLATVGAAAKTYGDAGAEWSRTAAGLPAGTYDIRAIAQYTTGPAEASTSETPVSVLVIKSDAIGNKLYTLNPEEKISASVGSGVFTPTYAGAEQTFTGTLSISSSETLTNVRARMVLDGTINIDRYLTVSGSGSSWSAALDLSDVVGGGSGRIVIDATDGSSNRITSSIDVAVAASALKPAPTAGRVTAIAWPAGPAGNLENSSALAIFPAAQPTTPATQSSLVKLIGEPWKFMLSDPHAFKTSNSCEITMTYDDVEIPSGADESKIGVAYWDAAQGKWTASGITGVTRNLVANQVTFTVSHFSIYALAIIDTDPAVTFISPYNGGMTGKSPIIEANILDGFSSIREVKVMLNGLDRTAEFAAFAPRDGIDNDGNGLIDEGAESAFNRAGETSAKYKVRPGLHLSDGSHTLSITATNEQGISATSSVNFTIGGAAGILAAHMQPNPYDSGSGSDAEIKLTMSGEALITLKVYDFGGKLVYQSKTNEPIPDGGSVFWNGRTSNNQVLANGVYLIKIEASNAQGSDSKVIKAALLR